MILGDKPLGKFVLGQLGPKRRARRVLTVEVTLIPGVASVQYGQQSVRVAGVPPRYRKMPPVVNAFAFGSTVVARVALTAGIAEGVVVAKPAIVEPVLKTVTTTIEGQALGSYVTAGMTLIPGHAAVHAFAAGAVINARDWTRYDNALLLLAA